MSLFSGLLNIKNNQIVSKYASNFKRTKPKFPFNRSHVTDKNNIVSASETRKQWYSLEI